MSFNWSQTLRSAERYLSRGKIAPAIDEYCKLVESNPTDLSMLNTLGDLYIRAGLNEEARLVLSRAVRGYRHQGFTSKAIAILKKLIRIHPADLDSAISLAECYLIQGLRGDARRQYAYAAGEYERAGRDDKALDIYQRMAEINPSETSIALKCAALGQVDIHRPCESHSRTSSDAEMHRLPGCTYLDPPVAERLHTDLTGQLSRPAPVAAHEFLGDGILHRVTSITQPDSLPSAGLSGSLSEFELISVDDRRKSLRVPLRIPLVVISETCGWREYTETIDVSEEGLRLRLAHPLRPMTVLKVLLQVAEVPAIISRIGALKTTQGIVRYCNWPGKPNLIGLELDSEYEGLPNPSHPLNLQ